jgi:hypothetical protein
MGKSKEISENPGSPWKLGLKIEIFGLFRKFQDFLKTLEKSRKIESKEKI